MQPLPVYRVLSANGAQSRLDVAATRGLTPLVGRDAEVALLLERWRCVQAGQGQVVLLVGEAGLGKSRLVRVLQDHLAAETLMILEGRGSPCDAHTALYPVVDLLQGCLQWRPAEAPNIALRRLETLLTQAQIPLAEAVPLLATFLALPLATAAALPLALGPEQQRQRTFELLLALMGGLAERQPVLLVLKDLHWMDPSTLEWLTRLLDEGRRSTIFSTALRFLPHNSATPSTVKYSDITTLLMLFALRSTTCYPFYVTNVTDP